MRITAQGLFSLFLAVLVLLMILISLRYSGGAQFFPILFGGATLVLLLFQLFADWFAGIEKRLFFVAQESVFSKLMEQGEGGKEARGEEKKQALPWVKVFRLFLWLGLLTYALLLFNYVAVVSIFIFLMIAFEAGAGWGRAFVAAACAGLFFFILFGMILHVAI